MKKSTAKKKKNLHPFANWRVRVSHFWESLHIDQLLSQDATRYMQVLAASTRFFFCL